MGSQPENPATVSGPLRRDPRRLWIWLGIVGACAVIGVDLWFILCRPPPGTAPKPGASALAASARPLEPPPLAATAPLASAPPSQAGAAAPGMDGVAGEAVFEDEVGELPKTEAPAKRPPPVPVHYATVQEAAARSCSTSSVDGLSRQIIDQARCLGPTTLVRLPELPNLTLGPQVFPYLEARARDRLIRVLKANPKSKMTVNSALRTVAQQYLVRRWSAGKRCGVQLATAPGDSNHEIGLALDIAEPTTWRAALEAEKFQWFGRADLVHFDYQGNGGTPPKPLDVRAFQMLWNRNHPDDKIPESGKYDTPTEQKLKLSPPDGFPKGAYCSSRSKAARSNEKPAKALE